jgi:hypothetical protein
MDASQLKCEIREACAAVNAANEPTGECEALSLQQITFSRADRQPESSAEHGDASFGTLPFPLVIAAQARLMLFYLCFQFAESLLAARSHIASLPRGVQRSGGHGQIERERMFLIVWIPGKHSVQLQKVRLVALQKSSQFSHITISFQLHCVVRLDMLVADG